MRWGALAWAFVIVVAGMQITPGGINPIVTNPVVRISTGSVLIIIAIVGLVNSIREK